MKVVSIGRRSSNEVVINDPLVSREQHCVITEENNLHYIFDANSKNGTYVNGSRIPYGVKTRLHKTDVVRIGNTVLPWQSYFKKGDHVDPPTSISSPGPSLPIQKEEATTTALQAIALVLSLIGMGLIAYVGIKISSWSIFGLAFNYTKGLIGAGCCLVALIFAKIAENQEQTDNTTMATIAEWISSLCLIAVVAFVIILNVDSDFLNPFANIH